MRILVQQRALDHQWTWRVKSRNGKQVAWAGEFMKRRGSAMAIVRRLFGSRFPITVTPVVGKRAKKATKGK